MSTEPHYKETPRLVRIKTDTNTLACPHLEGGECEIKRINVGKGLEAELALV